MGNTKNDHVATSTCLEWQLKYVNVSIILSPRTLDIIGQCTRSYTHGRHVGESLPVNHGESTGAWYYFQDCFVNESNIKAMVEYFIYDIKMNAQK